MLTDLLVAELNCELSKGRQLTELTERMVTLKAGNGETVAVLVDIEDDERFAALADGRKMFVDVVKMAVYRAETAMAELIRECSDFYGDEARAILRSLYQQPADLTPNLENKTLTVTVYPLPEKRQCDIAEKICELLNESEICYPGTGWALHYKMLKTGHGVNL